MRYDVAKKSALCTKHKEFFLSAAGGLWDCEILSIPHCMDHRLTDDGEVVSLTHRPRSRRKFIDEANVSGIIRFEDGDDIAILLICRLRLCE
jgi:hypothetical protein